MIFDTTMITIATLHGQSLAQVYDEKGRVAY